MTARAARKEPVQPLALLGSIPLLSSALTTSAATARVDLRPHVMRARDPDTGAPAQLRDQPFAKPVRSSTPSCMASLAFR